MATVTVTVVVVVWGDHLQLKRRSCHVSTMLHLEQTGLTLCTAGAYVRWRKFCFLRFVFCASDWQARRQR